MKAFTLTAIVLTLAFALHADETRARFNFNSGWLLHVGEVEGSEKAAFADADWKPITLPHAWNEDSAFKASIDELPTGIAWYRKHFKLPAGSEGRKVFLEFEGIRQGGEFYLNGMWIGRSDNGVMAFGFDITDKVKQGQENVLAARIDNSWHYRSHEPDSGFQWNDKNFYANYGGINKNVALHITDKLHQTLPLFSNLGTTGVYVHAQDFDIAAKKAKITAESELRNDRDEAVTVSYEVSVAELGGKVLKTFKSKDRFESLTLQPGETRTLHASSEVTGLDFWSWGYGALYDVTTTLLVDGKAVDSVVTRTGFRKLEFTNGMVRLNDRAMHIHGYAQRSTNEWPGVGQSVPPWMSDFSNDLVVQSGGNLIRWMHVTPHKQDIESCDRVGLPHAVPAGDAESDETGKSWTLRTLLMRDAIIYNRNNPSIIFWETGNNQVSEQHMAEMKAIARLYDPHGGRASGSRNMFDSQIAEYGGEMLYINKSAKKPMWMMEYSRDEGLRKYWDDWSPPFHKDGDGPPHRGEPAPSYNRNQDTHAIENVVRWHEYWQQRPGTGERVNAGGVNIYFSDSNTHYRGAANYRCSGEVDAMRLPKQGFYAHQVMWDGWVNVERPRIHIIGHWNYATGVKKLVQVVSSAEKVELWLNGKSLGQGQQSHRFLFTWAEVVFEPGDLKAVGSDAGDKRVCEAVLNTAGEPVALKLTPHSAPGGLKADGADMLLVDVEAVDAKGRRCPTALNMIDFALEGPAEWRGGIAVGKDNFILAKKLPVECGINRVILRSLPKAGKITLKASSEGLKAASLEVTSTAVEASDGLSTTFADGGLAPRLDRGPTPAGDGLTSARKAIHIVSAKVASNDEAARFTFDDNEATKWKNNGKRETAWIEFQLEREATVNEIVLKLGGWRKTSYPLRITVDGKEAFTGTTPKSLGYVNLSLKPTKGKTVRIELAGEVKEKDEFGLVEITGKKLADAVGTVSKGALEIVEAEVYEPLH